VRAYRTDQIAPVLYGGGVVFIWSEREYWKIASSWCKPTVYP